MPHSRHTACCLAAILPLVVLAPAALAASDTLYVNWAATGANNGTTWEDAYTDLQDALGYARASGGEVKQIIVARGTYKPDRGTGDRWATFRLPRGVKVLGGYSFWEGPHYTGEPTVLSGEINSPADIRDNTETVVTADPTADSDTILDGFIITGGHSWSYASGVHIFGGSPIVRNCAIMANTGGSGGGLQCENSQATITDCVIRDNQAREGGGACLSDAVTVIRCTFRNNTATQAGGAGARCTAGVSFSQCKFERNTTPGEGGGLLCLGSATVSDCSFDGNVAGLAGGGISVSGTGTKFIRCSITSNTCSAGGGVCAFGSTFIACAITANEAPSRINGMGAGAVSDNTVWASCLFASNTAGMMGGGIYCIGPTTLAGCTVSANTAPIAGGVYNAGAQIVVDSSIIWGNAGGSLSSAAPQPQVTYSDIEGGCPGEGNINTDPWPSGDIIPSPCHNTGNPGYVSLPEETDIAGRPRIAAGRIDMGAHEQPAGTLAGDINADGCCDVIDLLYLYGSFGTSAGDAYYDFFCDLNSDGMIDVVDLLTMVENFGTCLE